MLFSIETFAFQIAVFIYNLYINLVQPKLAYDQLIFYKMLKNGTIGSSGLPFCGMSAYCKPETEQK